LIACQLQASAALRQIGRTLGCTHSTVGRALARLGRHCMLLLARALAETGVVHEPVVIDHFEAFELSQDLPLASGPRSGTGAGSCTGSTPPCMSAGAG
jgi:hypothetical protein